MLSSTVYFSLSLSSLSLVMRWPQWENGHCPWLKTGTTYKKNSPYNEIHYNQMLGKPCCCCCCCFDPGWNLNSVTRGRQNDLNHISKSPPSCPNSPAFGFRQKNTSWNSNTTCAIHKYTNLNTVYTTTTWNKNIFYINITDCPLFFLDYIEKC